MKKFLTIVILIILIWKRTEAHNNDSIYDQINSNRNKDEGLFQRLNNIQFGSISDKGLQSIENNQSFKQTDFNSDKLFFAGDAENMMMIKGVLAEEHRVFSYGLMAEFYQLNVLGEGLPPISMVSLEARTFRRSDFRYYSFTASTHMGIALMVHQV